MKKLIISKYRKSEKEMVFEVVQNLKFKKKKKKKCTVSF